MGQASPDPKLGAMAWLNLVWVTQKPEKPEAALSGLLWQEKKKEKKWEKKKKKNLSDALHRMCSASMAD